MPRTTRSMLGAAPRITDTLYSQVETMADDREVRESDPLQQQSQERPEQAQQTPLVAEPGTTEEELPDVPPPPYPGPPDGAEGVAAPSYPPQQVPPYMYPPGQGPDDSAVMHPMPYPPKVCYQYPPPGYHYQYPPPGQGLGTAGYPGYQAPPSYPPQQPSLGNALVVTTQPLGGNDVTSSYPAEPKPDSHLMLSILTCLCCSPIFGFFAICLSREFPPLLNFIFLSFFGATEVASRSTCL